MKNKLRSLLILFLLPVISSAQEIEMADTFREDGKIYVVIAVITVILAGLFIYLFMLGNKVSKLERKLNEKK